MEKGPSSINILSFLPSSMKDYSENDEKRILSKNKLGTTVKAKVRDILWQILIKNGKPESYLARFLVSSFHFISRNCVSHSM